MLDEILEEAAERGDPLAVAVMMQRGFRGNPTGPFAEIERQQHGEKIVDLAMAIVEGGDASILSELSAMFASNDFGRPSAARAYESLFAYALDRADDPAFQNSIDHRLARLRQQLSSSEAAAAEARAHAIINKCCQ